jgi:hypothetical protein
MPSTMYPSRCNGCNMPNRRRRVKICDTLAVGAYLDTPKARHFGYNLSRGKDSLKSSQYPFAGCWLVN